MTDVVPIEDEREPLASSMRMLLQFGRVISPTHCHRTMAERAKELQHEYRHAGLYKAEAIFMRVLQDGVNFSKWPVEPA